jgi:hypothetical protein
MLSFRDPEELRIARISDYRDLADALDSSVTRSAVRKDVALSLFPQPASAGDDCVRRAESALAHKLGPNRDQNFDVGDVLPLMKLLKPDEQIDVFVFMLRELKLEIVDGTILPRHRPSKAAAVDALRKDVGAFNAAIMARLDAIAGEGDDE